MDIQVVKDRPVDRGGKFKPAPSSIIRGRPGRIRIDYGAIYKTASIDGKSSGGIRIPAIPNRPTHRDKLAQRPRCDRGRIDGNSHLRTGAQPMIIRCAELKYIRSLHQPGDGGAPARG